MVDGSRRPVGANSAIRTTSATSAVEAAENTRIAEDVPDATAHPAASAETPRLRIDARDDRVVATLDRPDVRNAIDQRMVDELHALCAALEVNPRMLILTGAGGIFAAGADIAQLRERTGDDARRGINATVFDRLRHLPLPVIAAVDGFALGGGAELAYAADIRIGTPRVRFGNPEPGLGIIAAAGASWRLPEIVGHARASELLLTARVIDADEALAWGLLSSIHDPDALLDAAHAIADRIAANSARATILTKRALLAPRAEHPAIDGELQAELFDSADKCARMTAFLERKKK
ncbi:Enoyl-CoA hydratase/carnithine racemase [Microbacterium sp. ru370.1]|uniref:enoyl-CoA hydratase/isomerase family protein n=1 Tax=unclassified Microbacterium TaxID=2609290 RepID=UPI0008823EE1|nr:MULTISPECIES: enoyl-CoA hydratase/isomerase family protein [unclassified Microbacterium]SDP00712.1 Enoyl-CoA hydratase/carnithine racemase [Microbacterium sp. ru370.1]SIT92260.1 Enoyl-CoA hydratase/carnithine racemase [Microbacterium sp. RU1D]